VKTLPLGRKARPITDVASTALRKEEMTVRLSATQDEHPLGGSNVAYLLKSRIVESQQQAITRQQPVNNRGIVYSVHTTVEYIMPLLSNNRTVTDEQCFLCSPRQGVISRTRWQSVRELLRFSHCKLLLLEAGS
jgi:hypothetical protein